MSPTKVLVVNSSDHDNRDNLGPIEHILSHPIITKSLNLSIQVTSYQNARYRLTNFEPDLLLMSGRNYQDKPSTKEEAQKWYSWINNLDIPVFTICGSYQRWVISLGGEIVEGNPEIGLIPTYLRNHQDDPLHSTYSLSRTFIHNHHRFFVENSTLPKEIVLLGHTLGGTSIVKHISKPIYGFQGHPEKAFTFNNSMQDSLAQQYSTIIFQTLLKIHH